MSEPNRELLDQPRKPSIFETLLMCQEKQAIKEGGFSNGLTTTSLPKSQVLGKIQNFLGEIAKANEKLELEVREKPREEFDLEALTGNEKEYIEMDLVLGVADLNSEEAIAAAEANVSGFQPVTTSVTSSSSSSDESDEEDEKYTVDSQDRVRKQEQEKAESPQENKPQKKQKKIVVLN